MTPLDLPSRWRMGLAQIRRGTLDAPWSLAPWASVARRTIVLVGFVAYGLVTGELDTAIFGAFGALQLGLGEAVLPWRGLLRLVVLEVLALTAAGFVAAWTGGTWWTVPLLAAMAFAHGATFTGGQLPRAVGIGALAIGVIFAGLPIDDPISAALWLGFGAACQGLLWLVVWPWERSLTIRRALANRVRDVSRIIGFQRLSGRESNTASAATDDLRVTISQSGVPDEQAAVAVLDAIDDVRRSAIAWRVLRGPGLAERLSVQKALRGAVSMLDESVGPARRSVARVDRERWPSAGGLVKALDVMQDRIDSLCRGTEGVHHSGPADSAPAPRTDIRHPDLSQLRHGMRLALAIAVAQAITLVIPITHSFWIPLTVVFVVRPEWYTTVIRSAARVLGNLLAVILVPAGLALTSGFDWATVILVAVIAIIAFRNFSGSYAAASFGVAGTILVLDQTLGSDPILYEWRIAATIIGTVVGLVVSAMIPAYTGRQGLRLLRRVVAGLDDWSREVCRGLIDPAGFDPGHSRDVGDKERNNLIHLRPAVAAALVEPRPPGDPRALLVALDAADRAHLCLLALTFHARLLHADGSPGLDVRAAAQGISVALDDSARRVGVPVAPTDPLPQGAAGSPRSPEDLAVTMQVLRLQEAAEDLAAAAAWVAPDASG